MSITMFLRESGLRSPTLCPTARLPRQREQICRPMWLSCHRVLHGDGDGAGVRRGCNVGSDVGLSRLGHANLL
jgi:hypothetical protein